MHSFPFKNAVNKIWHESLTRMLIVFKNSPSGGSFSGSLSVSFKKYSKPWIWILGQIIRDKSAEKTMFWACPLGKFNYDVLPQKSFSLTPPPPPQKNNNSRKKTNKQTNNTPPPTPKKEKRNKTKGY